MRMSSSSSSSRMRMELHKGIFRIPLHYKLKALTGGKSGCEESVEKLLIVREMSDDHQDEDEKARQVPKGFLAVYVGRELRRFVIPASYLSMPDFRGLMEKAAEEFGYEQEGGLRIPCEEEEFEDILQRCLSRHQMMSKSIKNQIMLISKSTKNQIMFMFMSNKSTKNQIMFMSKSRKRRD